MGGNGPVAVEISCSSSVGIRQGDGNKYRFCYFSGSSFSTFWCPGFASLRAPVFLFFGLWFLHFSVPKVCILSGSAFFILRAPVSTLFGTRGVYLFGLRFFYFSVSGVCMFVGSSFLFFRLWFLHFSVPEVCIFLGSGFCTFWHPRCAFLRALVFLFFGSDCHG